MLTADSPPHLMVSLQLVLVSAVASLAAAVPAQTARGLGRSGADYFPLHVGAAWDYQRTRPGTAPVTVSVVCRREGSDPRSRYFELRASDGQRTEVRTWRAGDDGVLERLGYAYPHSIAAGDLEDAWAWAGKTTNTEVLGRLTVNTDLCWLTGQPGLQTEWSLERGRSQEAGGTPALPLPGLRYDARVESFADEVTVPAGTYVAIKVVVDVRADDASLHQRVELWLARDVGPVRRVVSAVDARTATVLQSDALTASYLPASGPSLIGIAKAFVQANVQTWPDRPDLFVLEDPQLGALLGTRFVLLRTGARHALLAIDRRGARVFDPALTADVQALAMAEGLGVAGAQQSRDFGDLARACLMLQAIVVSGKLTVPAVVVSGLTRRGPARALTIEAAIKANAAARLVLTVTGTTVTDVVCLGVTR